MLDACCWGGWLMLSLQRLKSCEVVCQSAEIRVLQAVREHVNIDRIPWKQCFHEPLAPCQRVLLPKAHAAMESSIVLSNSVPIGDGANNCTSPFQNSSKSLLSDAIMISLVAPWTPHRLAEGSLPQGR